MLLRLCLATLIACAQAAAVTPFRAGPLLLRPARFVDLSSSLVRFTPRAESSYSYEASKSSRLLPRGTELNRNRATAGKAWAVQLPFLFPFAGRRWSDLHVNLNGNVSFLTAESTIYPQRETWSDGTMRSMAAALYLRSVAGKSFTIAPLWAMNAAERSRVFTRSTGSEFIVTWNTERYQSLYEGYRPRGRNTFQLRLTPQGSIEFRYGLISERDGIAGIFGGSPEGGSVVDEEDGISMHDYGPHLEVRGGEEALVITGDEGFRMRSAGTACFHIAGSVAGPTDCPVGTLSLPDGRLLLPKTGLQDPSKVQWLSNGKRRNVTLKHEQPDLSAGGGGNGSVFEVFHYPVVPKARPNALKYLYQSLPAEDDLALVFTDFRIDDIHNHGGSNRSDEDPRLTAKLLFGSEKLQGAAGPVYLGPRFEKDHKHDRWQFTNHAFGVGWMAHELIHRWAARLQYTGKDPNVLLEPSTLHHWNPLLVTPAVHPVWKNFSNRPYPEPSVMGGMVIEDLPDGRKQGAISPSGAVSGLCALDLYVMGLIGPDDVPDTFYVDAANESGHVTIAEIRKANPAPPNNRGVTLHLGIYLLHEDGRDPDPAKLALARSLEASIVRYFDIATGGRMKLSPN